MSQEQQDKIDDAVQTTTPNADVAGQPPSGPKKSPLMVIIAVIVVIALIATAFSVLMMGGESSHPELTVRVSPMSVSIANGSQIKLTPYATFKNSSSDAGTNVSGSNMLSVNCKWSVGAAQIGTLTRGLSTDGLTYFLLKSNKVGTSSLNWSFRYVDENSVSYDVYKIVNVNVSIALLSYVEINPAEKVLFKGKSQLFTARALLTNDTEVPADFTWWLSDPNVGNIMPSNGSSTTLTAGLVNASGDLVCNGTYLGTTVSSTAKVNIITVLPTPSTKARFYNLLDVPLGDFWNDRYLDEVIRDTYPVATRYPGAAGSWIYSDCSLNVVAKNISKANTSENPVYLPILNPTVRGGNIEIDWNGSYLTKAQVLADYSTFISGMYDSWFFRTNGTVTMDRTAARMVMNMTNAEFDDFAKWKADKFSEFKQKFATFIQEQWNIVWAIKFSYEAEGSALIEEYDVEKVGDKIVFKILDHLSWGLESLVSRWWRATFLPYEGWPDDFHFVAQIGPLVSNFTLDMTVPYLITAMNSTRDGRTSWILELQCGDSIPGSEGPYVSEFNKYYGKKTWSKLIASSVYMQWRDFDYTPTAWSLPTSNDTITIEWPGTASTAMGYNHAGTDAYSAVSGKITPLWIEPIPGEVPSNVFIDNTARAITIKGPFDAIQWSKTTLAGRELRENWSRLGVLPQGVPRIEFVVNNDANQKPIAALAVPKIWGTNSSHTLGSGSFDVDGSIVSYEWAFGDGSPNATTAVPTTTHTWTTQANCTVSLKVTDDDGLWAMDSTVVQIVDNLPPVADLNNSNIYGDIQTPTLFNGDESYDQNALNDNSTIVSYEWDFGDGNTSVTTTSRTSHQYAEMGIYDVTLTVVDDLGSTDSDTVTFVITTDLCAKIVMQRSATVGDNVVIKGNRSFTFSASHGRTLANWTWDFGDGSKAYTQNVTHAWSTAGVFTVNLVVRDNLGLESENATAKIVIATASVTGLGLSLVRHSLLPGESTTLTIKAVNDAGKVVTSFSGNVLLTANGSGWTLPSPTALVAGVGTATVSCTTPGSYNITAAVQGTPSQNGSIFATVNNRTVEITVYDIFEYPLQDFVEKRWIAYGSDQGLRNSSPSINIYREDLSSLTSGVLTTAYTLKVEARNIPEINMSSPTFTALRNPTTGKGNATVVLDYHMMTEAEVYARDGIYWTAGKAASWDGWEYFLTYNVTMDRAATEQIINLPSASWATAGDVDTWWAANNLTVNRNWNRAEYPVGVPGYLGAEGGYGTTYTGRLDIRACEDYYNYGMGLWNTVFRLQYIDADHVSLTYFNVGYGYDALLAKFMYWGGPGSGANYPNGTPNGIVPFEPWYENMSLRVDICDDHANLTMYGTVNYGFRAWGSETAPANTAAFRWEILRIDYCLTQVVGQLSELDIYAPYRNESDPKSLLRDPGSSLFDVMWKYDWVPTVVTLKPGESIIMQAPRELTVGYMPKKFIGDYTDASNYLGGYYDFLRILEVFGNATIHPVGCYPGTYTLDKEMGDMTIVGPFVPIINYRTDITWLVDESAPRIELWIQ